MKKRRFKSDWKIIENHYFYLFFHSKVRLSIDLLTFETINWNQTKLNEMTWQKPQFKMSSWSGWFRMISGLLVHSVLTIRWWWSEIIFQYGERVSLVLSSLKSIIYFERFVSIRTVSTNQMKRIQKQFFFGITLNNQFFSSPFISFDQLPMITLHFDWGFNRCDWKYDIRIISSL